MLTGVKHKIYRCNIKLRKVNAHHSKMTRWYEKAIINFHFTRFKISASSVNYFNFQLDKWHVTIGSFFLTSRTDSELFLVTYSYYLAVHHSELHSNASYLFRVLFNNDSRTVTNWPNATWRPQSTSTPLLTLRNLF